MGKATFDGYVVTTTNPGNAFLVLTFIFCVLCFLIGGLALIVVPFKKVIDEKFFATNDSNNPEVADVELESTGDDVYHLHQERDQSGVLRSIKNMFRKKKRNGGILNVDSESKLAEITVASSMAQSQKQNIHEKVKRKVKKRVKITVGTPLTRIGRFEEKLEFQDFSFWRNESKTILTDESCFGTISGNGADHVSDSTEISGVGNAKEALNKGEEDDLANQEMKKIFGLSAPWIVQSVVGNLTGVIYMMLLSHFVSQSIFIIFLPRHPLS